MSATSSVGVVHEVIGVGFDQRTNAWKAEVRTTVNPGTVSQTIVHEFYTREEIAAMHDPIHRALAMLDSADPPPEKPKNQGGQRGQRGQRGPS